MIDPKYVYGDLSALKEQVNRRNDAIPFLLLPIRLETRFMKVEREKKSGEGTLNKVWDNIAELTVELGNLSSTNNRQEAKRHADILIRKLNTASSQLNNQEQLSHKQQSQLRQINGNLDSLIQKSALKLNRLRLRNDLNNVRLNWQQWQQILENKETGKDQTFENAKQVIQQLATMAGKMEQLSFNDRNNVVKIPYTASHQKKRLYQYVKKIDSLLFSFYQPRNDRFDTIKNIDPHQLDRIKALNKTVRENITGAIRNLRKIHRDHSWREFISEITGKWNQQLKDALQYFESNSLPKLEFRAGLKTAAAEDLLFQSLVALIDVEKAAIAKKPGFSELKASRKKIQEKVNKLARHSGKIVEADAQSLATIKNIYGKLDQSFKKFDQQLQEINLTNDSQRFGLNYTRNLVRNQPTKVISGILNQDLDKIKISSGYKITKSEEFLFNTKSKLDELSQNLSSSEINPENYKQELNAFSEMLTGNLNQETILDQSSYQELQQKSNQYLRKVRQTDWIDDSERQKIEKELNSSLENIKVMPEKVDLDKAEPVWVTSRELVDELWVRFFPDDIHIHTHEEKLTNEEVESGREFWLAYWAASNDHDLEMGAWNALLGSYGVTRAAWIANSLDPRKENGFAQKPSRILMQSIGILKQLKELFKVVKKEDSLPDILRILNETAIQEDLATLLGNFNTLNEEQAYLLDKAAIELRRIESRLYILQKKISALTTEESNSLNDVLPAITGIFAIYQQLRTRFQTIQPLSGSEWLARHDKPFEFPAPATKDKDWTHAPVAKALPERMAVITMREEKVLQVKIGRTIPADLQVGIDPAKFDLDDLYQLDENGDLQVEEGMRWMVNYQEAEKKGMAVSIPLQPEDLEKGFDRVLAIGISDETNQQELIESLLNNHHFAPDGLSFLKINTPTNNTSDEASGYQPTADPDHSFQVELTDPLFNESVSDPFLQADGARMASMLGVSPAIFHHIENSELTQVSDGHTINKALWNATLGYYLEDIWDTVFTYDNIYQTRDFFRENVTARGILPSFRIGQQPYGILPTSALSRFRFHPTFDQQNLPPVSQKELRFKIRLQKLLDRLWGDWTDLRKTHVLHSDKLKGENAQQLFVEMLGLQAGTVDYFFRYAVNVIRSGNIPEEEGFSAEFAPDSFYGPLKTREFFSDLMEEGVFTSDFDFLDESDPHDDPEQQKNRKQSRIRDQFVKARLYKSRFLEKNPPLAGSLITIDPTENDLLPPANGIATNYIQWLLQNDLYDLLQSNQIDQLPDNSLLFLLLRQSLLTAYRDAALNILQDEGFFNQQYRNLIGSGDKYRVWLQEYDSGSGKNHFTHMTKWSFLFRDLENINGIDYLHFNKADAQSRRFYNYMSQGQDKSMANYLYPSSNSLFQGFSGSAAHRPYLDQVNQVRDAMDRLQQISPSDLEQLLSEHLDLCTYRLDAWRLGLVNERLQAQRKRNPAGIHLGAFGWVEDLQPGGARNKANNVPEKLYDPDQPVYTDADNEGFIHAPSINHAVTAAILRSGYKSQSEEIEDLSNPMAVNLSSGRVRQALMILDGIRNGLELGAILGYQFERGLHERYLEVEMDKYIYPFRKKFPLQAPVDEAATTAESEQNPALVVNGLTLVETVNQVVDALTFEGSLDLVELMTRNNFQHLPEEIYRIIAGSTAREDLSSTQIKELKALVREIDRLADHLDALGDLAISESVYQLVQGNHVRAAAMVQSLAEGKVMPQPQIVNTPRTGTVVTQKVVLHLAPNPTGSAPGSGWPDQMTPRAKTAPSLNNWLATIIGNPDSVRCLTTVESSTGSFSDHEINLTQLNLQPIDLLFLLGPNPDQGSEDLGRMISQQVQLLNPTLEINAINIQVKARDEAWDTSIRTFYELDTTLKHLMDILNDECRSLDAAEVNLPANRPDNDNPGSVDITEYSSRIDGAVGEFEQLITDATNYLTAEFGDIPLGEIVPSSGQLSQIKSFLWSFSSYGVPFSVPQLIKPGVSQSIFIKQLKNTLKAAGKRSQEITALKKQLETGLSTASAVIVWQRMAKALFGKSFLALPLYQPVNQSEVAQQLNLPPASQLLRANNHFIMDEWLQGLASVRPRMQALEMLSLCIESSGSEFSPLKPVQFPYKTQDYWVGAEFPGDSWSTDPEAEILSLVSLNPEHFTSGTGPKTGLVIDEWIEIIPNTRETTGITFNYDQPDAMPPQSLLLAVTPQETGKWQWDDLVYTLIDTMEMAKNRAVEPDHLEKSRYAQMLPAIMSEVVPPELRDETSTNPLGTQVVTDFAENKLPEEEE